MQTLVDPRTAEAPRLSYTAVWAPPPGDVRSAPFRTG